MIELQMEQREMESRLRQTQLELESNMAKTSYGNKREQPFTFRHTKET